MDSINGYLTTPDGISLYAVFHPAGQTSASIFRPVLILPPLFEERKSAYATLRILAETLAAAGHPTLRFDWRGSGESGGKPGERCLSDLLTDATTTAQALSTWTTKAGLSPDKNGLVYLLGVRLSASLAMAWASEQSSFPSAGVIAIAPVVSGERQVRHWRLRSKMRAELTGQTAPTLPITTENAIEDFEGCDTPVEFFDAVAALNLDKHPPRLSRPTLLLQISPNAELNGETLKLLQHLRQNASSRIIDAEVVTAAPFWERLEALEAAGCPDLNEAVVKALRRMEGAQSR
jgi:alpha-beta hydrolase superfamily lysophospholipase